MSTWTRVSVKLPCPICHKPDWCMVGLKATLCNRIQSDKPSKGGGWYHFNEELSHVLIPIKSDPKIVVDCASMFQKWFNETDPKQLIKFSEQLCVDPMALHLIGCAWSPENNAWAFPMRDENFKIIGIRLRNNAGDKWSVKGSKAGVFICYLDEVSKYVIVEGPTDAAAALCMGFNVIGRPSCLGQEDLINRVLDKRKIKEVIIISDNDKAGMQGSERLQTALNISSVIITLPCKDIRKMLQLGGNFNSIESIVRDKIWKKV